MPASARNKKKTVTDSKKPTDKQGDADERMEDEEKVLAGRPDVNYPALLTKDVPGG